MSKNFQGPGFVVEKACERDDGCKLLFVHGGNSLEAQCAVRFQCRDSLLHILAGDILARMAPMITS